MSDEEQGAGPPEEHEGAERTQQPEAPVAPVQHDDPTEAVNIIGTHDESPLRFGADDTGPLPHWTEPPTGEVPRIFGEEASTDDLDAWSNLSSPGPVWRDDHGTAEDDSIDFAPLSGGSGLGAEAEHPADDDAFFGTQDVFPPPEPARVTPIRTRRIGGGGATAARRPGEEGGFTGTTSTGIGGRDLPLAIGVGVGIAVVALVLFALGPAFAMILVVAVIVLSAVEFYEKLREKGYQPATLVGLVAAAALPLASYWRGEQALPAVLFLTIVTTLAWFLVSGGIDSGPLPNTAVTMLGIVYIGFLGSFAALILTFPDGIGTLIVLALGVVAYDVGGLFVGSSAGRTPLLGWVSPNKTVEGLIGGLAAAFLVVLLVHFFGLAPWDGKFTDSLLLAIVVAVAAALGDLAESMLKRNLDVKDFGTILPGHGGVLDRFDSFLFVLPGVYYLSRVLQVY